MINTEVPRLVIIAAGDGGTTAEAFIHASQAGQVWGVVTDVIYNNPPRKIDGSNHVVSRIDRLNTQYSTYGVHAGMPIRTHLISNVTHPGGMSDTAAISDEASDAMCKILDNAHASLGLLLGFRKKVRGSLQTRYADKGLLTNNHPGRVDIPELRGMWGSAVHQRAHDLAHTGTITHTGLTVQLVAPEYDVGAVLETVLIPIGPDDTVQDINTNVQLVEKVFTPKIIDDYLLQLRTNL